MEGVVYSGAQHAKYMTSIYTGCTGGGVEGKGGKGRRRGREREEEGEWKGRYIIIQNVKLIVILLSNSCRPVAMEIS